MRRYTHIVLIGMKHSGKTTVGNLLAKELNLPFYDTDTKVFDLAGKTVRELYDEGGPELMMHWETKACRALSANPIKSIIASGGGLADNSEAFISLNENGLCIYLDTPCDVLFERIMKSAEMDGRLPPFLQCPDPYSRFCEIFYQRSKTYDTIAHVRVSTYELRPQDVAKNILELLKYEQ